MVLLEYKMQPLITQLTDAQVITEVIPGTLYRTQLINDKNKVLIHFLAITHLEALQNHSDTIRTARQMGYGFPPIS